jgi:hypothetical protein
MDHHRERTAGEQRSDAPGGVHVADCPFAQSKQIQHDDHSQDVRHALEEEQHGERRTEQSQPRVGEQRSGSLRGLVNRLPELRSPYIDGALIWREPK